MEYTYRGKNYPREIKLNYPELKAILSKLKEEITLGEASWLLSIAPEKMTKDCNSLILNEIGNQRGKTFEQLSNDKDVNPYIINNCLMMLTGMYFEYNVETSGILLELLCQPEGMLCFNGIGLGEDMPHAPVAAALNRCFGLSPYGLLGVLLRKDASDRAKKIVGEMVGILGANLRQHRHEALTTEEEYDELCKDLLDFYNKHAQGYPSNDDLDRISISCLVEAMSLTGVYDRTGDLPMSVASLFRGGYIDEEIMNEEDALDGFDGNGWDCEAPATEIRELLLPTPKDD